MLEFWQHVSAVKRHHQAKIEQCLGTMKVRTLWDPISFTIVGTLKVICWLILKDFLILVSTNISCLFTAETCCQNSKIFSIC